jgi:hypothetical protein
MQSTRRFATILSLCCLLLFLSSLSYSVELKPNTAAAFDRYVTATEARMAAELRPGGAFLYIDSLPPSRRDSAYRQLSSREVFISPLQTTHDGKSISIPDGMVHHWVGIIFIPNRNLATVLPVVQNYGNRSEVYKPDVIASRLISHQGDDYKIFMRFFQKKFTTIVLNTEFDIHWHQLDAGHLYSTSYSTRIAEVKDPDKPDGPELPAGKDHGYLWRLYTYWRFEEKDGGVYMQCEMISLTRDIPFGFGWLLRPLVTSIPRQSLTRTLTQTRAVILEKQASADDRMPGKAK